MKSESKFFIVLAGLGLLAYLFRDKLFAPKKAPAPVTSTTGLGLLDNLLKVIYPGINPRVPSFNPGGAAPRGSAPGAPGGTGGSGGIDASGLLKGLFAFGKSAVDAWRGRSRAPSSAPGTIGPGIPVPQSPGVVSYDLPPLPEAIADRPSSFYDFGREGGYENPPSSYYTPGALDNFFGDLGSEDFNREAYSPPVGSEDFNYN